jgi:hypothetical protein
MMATTGIVKIDYPADTLSGREAHAVGCARNVTAVFLQIRNGS